MKKIAEFNAEETGEEWLRELYKVVAMRRTAMFRLITETVRLLLFGNGGGAAIIIGLMISTGGTQDVAYHWPALFTLLAFGVGTLASALTMMLVAAVAVQEAHSSETALKRFADGEAHCGKAMFAITKRTFRLADFATASGLASAFAFMFGGVASIVLLVVFF